MNIDGINLNHPDKGIEQLEEQSLNFEKTEDNTLLPNFNLPPISETPSEEETILREVSLVDEKEISQDLLEKLSEFVKSNTDKTPKILEKEISSLKTVEDYEKDIEIVFSYEHEDGTRSVSGFYEAQKPDTPEFKHHDKEMAKIEAQYEKDNPKPEVNPLAKDISMNGLSQWEREKLEYMAKQEASYRKSHPEYAKQAEAYANKRQEAQDRTNLLM